MYEDPSKDVHMQRRAARFGQHLDGVDQAPSQKKQAPTFTVNNLITVRQCWPLRLSYAGLLTITVLIAYVCPTDIAGYWRETYVLQPVICDGTKRVVMKGKVTVVISLSGLVHMTTLLSDCLSLALWRLSVEAV